MNIFAALKAIVASIQAAILAILVQSSATIPVIIPEIPQVQAIEAVESPEIGQILPTAPIVDTPRAIPLVADKVTEAYGLGVEVGRVQGQIDALATRVQPVPPFQPAVVPQVIEKQPEKQMEPEKQSLAKVEIIDAIPSKGRGRIFKANDYQMNPDGTLKEGSVTPTDENSIELGLVCYDADGKDRDTAMVVVTATDASQNKTINGTGSVKKVYSDGFEKSVHYYPYRYEFRTPGSHTITFECDGMKTSVDLTAL